METFLYKLIDNQDMDKRAKLDTISIAVIILIIVLIIWFLIMLFKGG